MMSSFEGLTAIEAPPTYLGRGNTLIKHCGQLGWGKDYLICCACGRRIMLLFRFSSIHKFLIPIEISTPSFFSFLFLNWIWHIDDSTSKAQAYSTIAL